MLLDGGASPGFLAARDPVDPPRRVEQHDALEQLGPGGRGGGGDDVTSFFFLEEGERERERERCELLSFSSWLLRTFQQHKENRNRAHPPIELPAATTGPFTTQEANSETKEPQRPWP